MRYTIPVLLSVACGFDYELVGVCSAFGELTACPLELTHREAVERCEAYGFGSLVSVGGLEEQGRVASFGDAELGVPWWGGHDGSPYRCPMMQGGASAPSECSELRPFMCELDLEGG